MYALKLKPSMFFRLDGSSPFQDYSGYGRVGTLSGTAVKGVPLTADATYSQKFSRDLSATFASNIYVAGKESEPFSLAATIRPNTSKTTTNPQTYRENLVTKNPGMEGPTIGLTVGGQANSTIARYPNGSVTGSACASVVSNAAGDYAAVDSYTVQAGKTYTVSGYIYVEAGAPNITMQIFGNAMTFAQSAPFTAKGTWVRMSLTATANSNGTLGFGWVGTATGPGQRFFVDNLMLEQSSTLNNYFDGNFTGYEWSGTQYLSVSRARADISRVNLAFNPSFDAWSGGLPLGAFKGSTVTVTQVPGRQGGYAARFTATDAGNTGNNRLRINADTQRGITYAISFWARRISGTGYISLGNDGWGLPIGQATTNGSATPTQWTRYTTVSTVPANFGGGALFFANSVANDVWEVDDVQIEYGSTVTSEFSGDSPSGGWAGTPYNSHSLIFISRGDQQILSNQGRYDGLSINGTTVSFSTGYIGQGLAKCSYDIQTVEKLDLVGVHTNTKNSLYINGELVSEVDITAAQQAAVYDAPNSNLYSGLSSSGQYFLANNFATYPSALSGVDVAAMYRANNRTGSGSVASMFGGSDLPVEARTPYLDVTWNTDEAWNDAWKEQVTVDGDELTAMQFNGLTMTGTWIDTVDLYLGNQPEAVESVNLVWEGYGVVVETSVDGITWVPAVNGVNLSNVVYFDPSNTSLNIRVTFTSGLTEAYLSCLRVRAYIGDTQFFNNREISYAGCATFGEASIFGYPELTGTSIESGSVTIGPDESTVPGALRTIEMWVRPTGPGFGITGLTSTPTIYRNGEAYVSLPLNEWSLLHYVLPSSQDVAFSINGPGVLGKLAIYPTALSASEVAGVMLNYTGVKKVTTDGSGTVAVTESVTPAVIYAHDWEIVAG